MTIITLLQELLSPSNMSKRERREYRVSMACCIIMLLTTWFAIWIFH